MYLFDLSQFFEVVDATPLTSMSPSTASSQVDFDSWYEACWASFPNTPIILESFARNCLSVIIVDRNFHVLLPSPAPPSSFSPHVIEIANCNNSHWRISELVRGSVISNFEIKFWADVLKLRDEPKQKK